MQTEFQNKHTQNQEFMFGNMEEMQKELQVKLSSIIVSAEAGDGVVTITANANRQITNVSINKDSLEDVEELEDLVLVAINRVIEKASAEEAAITQEQLKNMMPPGMDGLSNLFG